MFVLRSSGANEEGGRQSIRPPSILPARSVRFRDLRQSARSVLAGSKRVARRARRMLASSPTAAKTKGTPMNVTGSVGLISNTRVPRSRLRPNAGTSPHDH